MAGIEPKVDSELLGRVAALTPAEQRWLRTVLQSVFTIDLPQKRGADEKPPESLRRAQPRTAESETAPGRRRKGLDELLSGEGASEEEYPELADELKGIADVANLLREGGRERRRVGEEIMRLLEGSEEADSEDEEDEGARHN